MNLSVNKTNENELKYDRGVREVESLQCNFKICCVYTIFLEASIQYTDWNIRFL
jgi:hypothetical protein